ncbi:hypothetical protein [Streptomyces sp. ME19-01-6]|nr:hypothetical protein [Streptomyces sp. ME19-01-6]MDX3228246.1 hypothetical protein [Streptomyces sp. ME19-01-6]
MTDGTEQPEQQGRPETARARRLAAWHGSTRALTSLAVGRGYPQR